MPISCQGPKITLTIVYQWFKEKYPSSQCDIMAQFIGNGRQAASLSHTDSKIDKSGDLLYLGQPAFYRVHGAVEIDHGQFIILYHVDRGFDQSGVQVAFDIQTHPRFG